VRIVALLNLGGGAVSRGVSHAEVQAALRSAGLSAEVWAVPGSRISAATREALAAGAELVIAAGGDGTVSAVAGALAGGTAALGVLPLGTFNHFARDLGISEQLPAAARTIATSQPRPVDLAEVNGHRFLNNAALGFAAQVVRERAEPRIRTRVTKAVATLVAAARLAGRYRMSEVCLDVAGRRVDSVTPFVFISNNAAEMHLWRLGRRPRLDGGELMVYVHHSRSRAAMLGTLLYAALRDVREAARYDEWLTKEAVIEYGARRRPVSVFVDGELLRLTPPLRFRVLPGRLLVAAPPTPAAEPATAASQQGPA
jgi:diacylglycerol kinase family enzyme